MPIIIKRSRKRSIDRNFDNTKIWESLHKNNPPKKKPFREIVKADSVKRSPGKAVMAVENELSWSSPDFSFKPKKLSSRAKAPVRSGNVVRTAPTTTKMKVPLKVRARPKKKVAKH